MDQIRQDLNEVITAVKNMDGAMHYMSQRVAWSETCYRQVQDSGVIHMAEAVRKIMEDYRKMQSQINMLTMRLAAFQSQGGGSESGGAFQKATVNPSTNRYGS